jgi:hypothetical protein
MLYHNSLTKSFTLHKWITYTSVLHPTEPGPMVLILQTPKGRIRLG